MDKTKQINIKTATFKVINDSPGHVTYGFWLNGAKIGDLTVRQEERSGFLDLLGPGFKLME